MSRPCEPVRFPYAVSSSFVKALLTRVEQLEKSQKETEQVIKTQTDDLKSLETKVEDLRQERMSNPRKRVADVASEAPSASRARSSVSPSDQPSTSIRTEASFIEALLTRIEHLEKSQKETQEVMKAQKDGLKILEAKVEVQKKEIGDLRNFVAAEKSAHEKEAGNSSNTGNLIPETVRQQTDLIKGMQNNTNSAQDEPTKRRRPSDIFRPTSSDEFIEVFVYFEEMKKGKYTVKKGTTYNDIRQALANQQGVNPETLMITGIPPNNYSRAVHARESIFLYKSLTHRNNQLHNIFMSNPKAKFVASGDCIYKRSALGPASLRAASSRAV